MAFFRKYRIPILVVLGAIVAIFVFRMQYLAKLYSIPTTSNEPALKLHSSQFASSLYKHEINDFIIFKRYDSIFLKDEAHFVYRLIAQEGDTVHIDKGITYVNGVNVDKRMILKHAYLVSRDEFAKHFQNENHECYPMGNDSHLCHIEDRIARELGLTRRMEEPDARNDEIFATYKARWNANYFGPLVIQKGHVFVMGDNRDNAHDSRYIGTIPVSDIVGVIKNK
ncbi:signal peptidase I [Aureisphaera galaxeae]|uniref:signal peptidase I n=1 Tax=Aureisphaera galaxeae TaxID=1538023 RepID=UPI0023503191|nr:signal peptidase I [Aureisphaera galaxeae]MDC8003487.1 signal peptidase I [Aureisphaera galaxeae]